MSTGVAHLGWSTPDSLTLKPTPNSQTSRRLGVGGWERGWELGVRNYFTCLLTRLVISNMFTWALPPKTGFSAASALIMRRFFWSWRLFFLM